MRRALLVVFAVGVLATQGRSAVNPNRYATVEATVVKVVKDRYPYAQVTLRVTKSSDSSLIDTRKGPVRLIAKNRFVAGKGSIDWTNPLNTRSISSFSLLQGDVIRAKLYPGRVRGSLWYITDAVKLRKTNAARERPAGGQKKVFDGLALSLNLPKTTFSQGEDIPFSLVVTNTGDKPKTLEFSTGQHSDFIVRRASDGEVWQLARGIMFTQVLNSKTLAPGEKWEISYTWKQLDDSRTQVPPGDYEVTGILTTGAEHPTAGPVGFKITPK